MSFVLGRNPRTLMNNMTGGYMFLKFGKRLTKGAGQCPFRTDCTCFKSLFTTEPSRNPALGLSSTLLNIFIEAVYGRIDFRSSLFADISQFLSSAGAVRFKFRINFMGRVFGLSNL